ncbi:MAG: hypothetical protein K2X66_05565 [Cyanobacteria bacterium]|nr:hypothetical protein [Cyanobacteriota bacterium]
MNPMKPYFNKKTAFLTLTFLGFLWLGGTGLFLIQQVSAPSPSPISPTVTESNATSSAQDGTLLLNLADAPKNLNHLPAKLLTTPKKCPLAPHDPLMRP